LRGVPTYDAGRVGGCNEGLVGPPRRWSDTQSSGGPWFIDAMVCESEEGVAPGGGNDIGE
jgi:hypothetical protein